MADRPENSQERLDSWKEIAAYLKRDVRTVQRWEKLEDLPVHRHLHNSLPSVYAYASEIDAWMENRRPNHDPEPSPVRGLRRWVLLGVAAGGVAVLAMLFARPSAQGPPASSELPLLRRAPGPGDVIQVGLPSPDGTLLPYGDFETGDLFVYEMTSGERRRLTHEASWPSGGDHVYASTFSPDNRRIAYSWYNGDGDFMDLRLLDVAEGDSEASVLYSDPEVGAIRLAEWSRDGSRLLALFRRKSGSSQLMVIDTEPRAVRVLRTFETGAPEGFSLSPDGNQVVYDVTVETPGGAAERDLVVLSAGDRTERPFVEDAGNDMFPLWTPDGRSVVFTSDRTGTLSVWKLDVDERDGSPVPLHKDLGRAAPLAMTRNGSYYFHLQTGMVNVFTSELDPVTGRVTSDPLPLEREFTGSNLDPDLSRDGRYLAYVSRRGHLLGAPGSTALVVRDLSAEEERVLEPELGFFVAPRFAPDGRTLVLKGRDHDDRWGLYQIDARTGDVLGFLIGGSIFEAAWTADGEAIVYNRQRRLMRYDLRTGEHEELYRVEAPSAILRFALSPDGEQIAVATSDSLRLSRMDGESGDVELHRLPDDEGLLSVTWSPDGSHILFTQGDHGPGERKLWRISSGGGAAEEVGLSMEGLYDVRVHPSGSRVIFRAGFPSIELWVMEHFLPDPPAGDEGAS